MIMNRDLNHGCLPILIYSLTKSSTWASKAFEEIISSPADLALLNKTAVVVHTTRWDDQVLHTRYCAPFMENHNKIFNAYLPVYHSNIEGCI